MPIPARLSALLQPIASFLGLRRAPAYAPPAPRTAPSPNGCGVAGCPMRPVIAEIITGIRWSVCDKGHVTAETLCDFAEAA